MKVFVSYSRDDGDWAREITARLRGHGVEVWSADALTPGQDWVGTLEQALRDSDALVVLLNHDTASRPNVLFELGAAMAGNKLVIPVVASELNLSALPDPWRGIQAVRRQSPERTAAEIARAVGSMAAGRDRRSLDRS